VKSPLVGTPSWVEHDSCLQALGMEEDGAVALPYVRRRLVLVEQRGLGWVTDKRKTQRAAATFFVKSSPCRHPELASTCSCLQVLGTDEDGAVALPNVRRRLVLVKQRGLRWVADRRETQRAAARFVVKSPPCRHPELGSTGFLLEGVRHGRKRSRFAAVHPTTTRFGGATGSWVGDL
jgi:hypothetical protein